MTLSILVVAYNCEIEDSATIKSLLTSALHFGGATLCIWNNGPREICIEQPVMSKLEACGLNTVLKQTITNKPLSWIYNTFIESWPSDNYVILDHDSNLTKEYLSFVTNTQQTFVGMPTILTKGVPRSPCSHGVYSAGPYTKKDYVTAIGSGITISKEVIKIVKAKYGSVFDNHFALYGVDTSFFARLNNLGLVEKLQSIPGFEHSLSRLEIESKEVTAFREAERSYDLGLMLRHYPSIKIIGIAAKQILLWPLGKNKIKISKVLHSFFTGCHARCKTAEIDVNVKGKAR